MVGGFDFLMYCLGSGAAVVSLALAVRLLTSDPLIVDDVPEHRPKREPEPDTVSDQLNNRLTEFQATRFSPPIVTRQVDPKAIPRAKLTKGRSFSQPAQPPRPTKSAVTPEKKGNVVQFPTKLKKGTPPGTGEDKEG